MMAEDPHRWLETIQNRREYVLDQLQTGTPVLAAGLEAGILMLGVGVGQSKVFEIHDRHAMAGLGHPSDLEKIRQHAIDASHVESYARSSSDVSLRRLVSFGLSPHLKSNFEHLLQPPHLVTLLFAEVGSDLSRDRIYRLHYDGHFEPKSGLGLACANSKVESRIEAWLREHLKPTDTLKAAADWMLQAWWLAEQETREPSDSSSVEPPSLKDRQAGYRAALQGRCLEIALLHRDAKRTVRYEALDPERLGL